MAYSDSFIVDDELDLMAPVIPAASVYQSLTTDSELMKTIRGTNGNDDLEGTSGKDTIKGLGGNDELDGKGGNDKLYGDAGKDELDGDTGKDKLFGGKGADELDGGRGNDWLTGGGGGDRFLFEERDGHDVIEDFGGKDRIELDIAGVRKFSDLTIRNNKEGDAVVTWGDDDASITLIDVSKSQLGASDFFFDD